MLEEIVLLTGEVEAPFLGDLLRRFNPGLHIRHAETAEQLTGICAEPTQHGGERRLIAFCTGVIVPASVLDGLVGPAYNFHPAPPSYPGSHPASFAVYEGAELYGVTVHEMTRKVDDGTIVAVEWFDMPPNPRFTDVEILAYKKLVEIFSALAERLAADPSPLPPSGDTWFGPKRTKRDFERMGEFTEDMDEDEIKRRFRAFG